MRRKALLGDHQNEPSPLAAGKSGQSGGVQSLERAFDLVELIASAPGPIALSRLAELSHLPPPTIHRLVRTLVRRGYIRQTPNRLYVLGPRFMRLGDAARRVVGSWAERHLSDLVDLSGETVHVAVLDYDGALYVAQVPSKHHMRIFTDVGRRVRLHLSAVGKVLLAQMTDQRIREAVDRQGMPAQTPKSITSFDVLQKEIEEVRARGYAIDNGEQEVGMRCIAVPVPGMPTLSALGISSPEQRLPDEAIARILPQLKETAARISEDALRQGETPKRG